MRRKTKPYSTYLNLLSQFLCLSSQLSSNRMRFLVIGSRQQLLKIHHCSVRVGTIDIKPVKVVRNLGAWFCANPYFYVL